MKITVRIAADADARDMARLLNDIIKIGGTTAITKAVTAQDIKEWMNADPAGTVWHVAVDDKENILGFQWIEPHPSLPAEACDIATFVQHGQTGLGVGSALFDKTRHACKALGYEWINANIREDNEGGLIYYQSRSFEDYGILPNQTLADGQVVNKRLKRYNL